MLGKIIVFLSMICLGLLGLLMSACGGFFVFTSLRLPAGIFGVLWIAVPSLAAGVGLPLLAVKLFRDAVDRR